MSTRTEANLPSTATIVARSAPRRRRSRARRWAVRLLALVASTALTLVIGEFAVRLAKPQVLFPRYVTAADFGIRVNVANARYRHTSPEMRAEFRINSLGVRSDCEYAFEKPAGVIRIVGVGDSFTQGYEVSVEDTYLYRLERLLRDREVPVEVINLGVSGHGTAEELIMLREFGLRFDPDIVVVGYFQNDLDDNIRANLYRLDEQDRPVRAAASYLPAIGLRDRLYSFAAYRWLAEHSHLLCLVRERVAALAKKRIVEKNTAAATQNAADSYSARLGARLLDSIKDECSQRGIGFALLDIPGADLESSNLPAHYLAKIGPEGIVRPVSALRDEGANAYLYRRRGHSHWTPRGHEIAARLLADKITAMIGERSAAAPAIPRTSAPQATP